jgi:hypothetical protein
MFDPKLVQNDLFTKLEGVQNHSLLTTDLPTTRGTSKYKYEWKISRGIKKIEISLTILRLSTSLSGIFLCICS